MGFIAQNKSLVRFTLAILLHIEAHPQTQSDAPFSVVPRHLLSFTSCFTFSFIPILPPPHLRQSRTLVLPHGARLTRPTWEREPTLDATLDVTRLTLLADGEVRGDAVVRVVVGAAQPGEHVVSVLPLRERLLPQGTTSVSETRTLSGEEARRAGGSDRQSSDFVQAQIEVVSNIVLLAADEQSDFQILGQGTFVSWTVRARKLRVFVGESVPGWDRAVSG